MKNLGSLALQKGQLKNLQITMFDLVPKCDNECRMVSKCPYEKKETPCGLRTQYISNVMDAITSAIDDKDIISLHKIGFMLVPLYLHLITFKIETAENKNPLIIGKKNIKTNPLYKEMRETIKLINSILTDLGVSKEDKKHGKGALLDGDSDYYNRILDGAQPL